MRHKRLVGGVILLFLMILEVYLATPWLPSRWQAWVSHALIAVSPNGGQSAVTHPALEQEIDRALEKNTGLRLTYYVFIGSLLAGNTILIVWITRRIRSARATRIGRSPDPRSRNT